MERREKRSEVGANRDAEANGYGSESWSGGPSRLFPACFYFFAFRWCTAARTKEEKRKRETTRLDEVLAACGIIKIQPCTNCWPVLPRCCCSSLLLYIHFLPPLDLLNPLLLILLILHLFSVSSMSSVRSLMISIIRSARMHWRHKLFKRLFRNVSKIHA